MRFRALLSEPHRRAQSADPILAPANEKSGRKRLIYAICCDRIVIPIYGAFSSRRTSDIPGVHRIGDSGTARRDRPHFCLLAPTGTGFSRISPKPKRRRTERLPYIIFIAAAGGGKAEQNGIIRRFSYTYRIQRRTQYDGRNGAGGAR